MSRVKISNDILCGLPRKRKENECWWPMKRQKTRLLLLKFLILRFFGLYKFGHMLVDICEIWQKVLVRGLAKSAYFRSASPESDNK